ncbi:hypothetical protein [Bradyrhizobium sp. AZCC 1678]|uniref:hypothetical protein n=1 Tax=Bradyrhizobium sp. AZCC 1678 TaxID=3117030 RepID=UPI002FF10715
MSEALFDAYFEISQLGDEMREAFDSTPEQFKENSGKEREVAADWLEAVLQPAVPPSIAGKEHWIEWLEMRPGKDGKLFRPARRDNAVRCLKAALAYAARVHDDSLDMKRFIDDTKIDAHNLETIHFPGMSGR